ncbi:unnamed protein product [Mytilus edulis]|uniref:C-type lectin domain-containing protein n=1 Tax=Mytilus edulis TaxID=6550 RepID=A0A8S3QUS8_MYTED|nr:unnamed protein product [Mytilus edulis]
MDCLLISGRQSDWEIKQIELRELYLLIIVVFLSISPHKGQIIPGQNLIDQQTDIFLIDDSGARVTSFVDDSGFGTGSDFGLPPIPFLPIALLMIPMVMMTMMSTVTSETSVAPIPVVPRTVLATVPTTQADVQTTPCVPTTCPERYSLLNDQTASPNCYFNSGDDKRTWADALRICMSTPGAYIWRPNTEEEANAVKNTFGLIDNFNVWTGANSPTHDRNFVFAVDNGAFSIDSVPFGECNEWDFDYDCVEVSLRTETLIWNWDIDDCFDEIEYVCEFPRVKNLSVEVYVALVIFQWTNISYP